MNKESLFSAFKKLTDEIAQSSEKLFQKVAEKLNDESEMHRAALNLHNKIQGVLAKGYKGVITPEIKQSIEDFLYQIKIVLEEDSESATSKYPVDQLGLAERCMQMLNDAKSHLEADPELWKLIQAHVMAYLEEVTRVIGIFDTEYSDDKQFNEYKQSIKNINDKLT